MCVYMCVNICTYIYKYYICVCYIKNFGPKGIGSGQEQEPLFIKV